MKKKADGVFEERVPFDWRSFVAAAVRLDATSMRRVLDRTKPTGWHMSFADRRAIEAGNFEVADGVKAHVRLATSRPDFKEESPDAHDSRLFSDQNGEVK